MAAVVGRKLMGSRTDNTIGILTYHRVADAVSGLPAPEHNVTPARFEQQLSGLRSQGYEFWSVDQLLGAAADRKPLPKRTVAVTFDDGYESVYTNAFPVLKELQIPATIFASTSFLDSPRAFPFDDWGITFQDSAPGSSYRPLTKDQCREMLDSGLIQIGAHTHTHQDFRDRADEFGEDLRLSVDFLREHLQLTDVSFAFPFGCPYRGFASSELMEAAKKAGVRCALTTESIPVDLGGDPFGWGRFTAFPFDTASTLAAKIEGWYEWAPKLRRRISRAVSARAN